MKCLIIGCGSIGTRRAKILVEMGHEVYGFDPAYDGDKWLAWYAEVGAQGSVNGEHIPRGFKADVALICTPPDGFERAAQITELATSPLRGLFMEKPIAVSGEGLEAVRRAVEDLAVPVTMGACNLRFAGGLDRLTGDWHWPYMLFTMRQDGSLWSKGHKPISLILDSIHELDLAVHLQGDIDSIRGWSDEDECEVSVHHTGGKASRISMDRSTYPPERSVLAQSMWTSRMVDLDTGPDMYVREMEHFMDCVEKGVPTMNSIDQAAETCYWALDVA